MKRSLIGLAIISLFSFAICHSAFAETIRSTLADNGFLMADFGSGTYLDGSARRAFHGVTLEDVKDCDFFGYFNGSSVSGAEKNFASATRITTHLDGNGKVDKIVFQIPARYGGTYQKAVVVELTNGENNCIFAKALAARYINSGSAQYNYAFFTMAANGTCTYAGNNGSIATGATAGGYGICGLGVTRIAKTTARLVFPGKTLEDLRGKYFTGYALGAWQQGSANNPQHGYNTVVTEDGNGVATSIRTEMQMMEGVNNKCVVIEFTNGDGGVYVKALASRYGENKTTQGLGWKFANSNTSFNGKASSVAAAYDQNGYGTHGLRADDRWFSGEAFAFLQATDVTVNFGCDDSKGQGYTLANVYDFVGSHFGDWVRDDIVTVPAFYVRRGNGTDPGSSISFEAQSTMGAQIRSSSITVSVGNDRRINARIDHTAYGNGAVGGTHSYLAGGTATSIAPNAYTGGYGIHNFGFYKSEHSFSASTAAAKWSDVPALASASAADGITTINLADTVTDFDFDTPMENLFVRLAGTQDVTLTMSGEPTVKYWDLTDLTGTSTINTPLSGTGITAGNNTVLASTVTNCAISVGEGNTLVAKTAAQLDFNGLHVRGKLKITDDCDISTLQDQWWGAQEVELAGKHTLTGGGQGETSVGNVFLWHGNGKLVISGDVTLTGGRNYAVTTAMPGPFTVVEGGKLTLGDRITFQAQNLGNGKGHLRVDGGLVTGGHLYMNTNSNGQELQIEVNGGRFESAIRPWMQARAPNIKIVQTGGEFAPSSLDIHSGWTGATQSALGGYTFKGGSFEPPAGWRTQYQWLPMTIPADGDVEFKIVRTATYPCAITAAAGAKVAFSSTDDNNVLTLFSIPNAGNVNFLGTHKVKLDLRGDTTVTSMASAADATWVKTDANAVKVLAPMDGEGYLGSIELTAGATTFALRSEIGGSFTLGTGATLVIDCGEATDLVDGEAIFTAEGGITLPEGVTVADVVSTSLGFGTLALSEDGKSILYTPDPTIPIVSTWTGAAGDGNLGNYANWHSKNVLGQDIDAAPQAQTFVHVSGDTDFAWASASTLNCRSLAIANAKLNAACDWSGLDWNKTTITGSVDLYGHQLTIAAASLNGTTYTDTTTDAAHPGELHVVVAADYTNSQSLLSGNLKFVKEGAAKLTVTLPQSYNGGTLISAGTMRAGGSGAPTGSREFGTNTGDHHAKIQVDAGGVLDIATGKMGWGYHEVALNGGTLTGGSAQPNFVLSLMADSTFDDLGLDADIGENGGDASHRLMPRLNGHTLEIKVKSGRSCFVGSTTGPGTIKATAGGWIVFREANTPADTTKRFDLDQGIAMNVSAATDVRDYNAPYNGNYMNGTAALRVFGTFTPTGNSFYGCAMQDGSAIDLSSKTEPWNVTRTTTGAGMLGADTVTFAENSTITVKTGARKLSSSVPVISWTTPPAETVAFEPEGDAYKLWKFEVRADGLYPVNKCTIIFIR